MGNQLLARYFYDGKEAMVFGCWDKETPEGQFDFYDVCDVHGNCLNLGDPFHNWPTWFEVVELLRLRG